MSTAVPEVNKKAIPQNPNPTAAPDAPPEAVLTQLITGGLGSQAVYVAAQLGIADLLTDGPKNVDELAAAANVDAPSLYRVLRALASLGVFAERDDQVFELTATAELLRSDSPTSLRHLAIFMGEDWHWRVWGRTLYSVRTGKAAWDQEHGCDVFPFFAANPEAAKVFDQAMTSLSNLAINAVIEGYDFSGFGTLVDVAGGQGRLLTAILAANPSVKGVLFDQPHVLAGAKGNEQITGLGSRCELVDGDFFASVPAGADAYIMKHIIHDWDDERAVKILRNVRNAMKPDGRVLLVESVITAGNTQDFGKLLDIEMLVSPGGKERTAEEYRVLFAKAGLRLTQIVPTKSPYSVIEAVPVR
ncbi:MAG TPA: methyltransferase [Pyrinomonadaceae bacterium]|jgi:SAM-dependent methyltransferase|nr:methyltransferase [Pyrinomonadaceae bacterium]